MQSDPWLDGAGEQCSVDRGPQDCLNRQLAQHSPLKPETSSQRGAIRDIEEKELLEPPRVI